MDSEKRLKKIFIFTLSGLALLLIAIIAFVVVVDPYQQYHSSDEYIGDQRLEIPGVAKTHDYNAFVSGSSMAMNHYPEQIDSVFADADVPWKTMNFTFMGARWDDYAEYLPFILSLGKAHNIIFCLDVFSFAAERNAFAKYLCNNDLSDDYKYWLNYTSFVNAIKKARNKTVPLKDLYHFDSGSSYENLLNDFIEKTENGGYANINEVFDLDSMIEKFDSFFMTIIDNSPANIVWYIYLPPYSIFEFKIHEKFGDLPNILAFRNHMCKRLLSCDNVKLYDFQCSPWITNTDEYMDTRHHSHKYNRMIIEEIHNQNFLLTPHNYRMKTDSLEMLIHSFPEKSTENRSLDGVN